MLLSHLPSPIPYCPLTTIYLTMQLLSVCVVYYSIAVTNPGVTRGYTVVLMGVIYQTGPPPNLSESLQHTEIVLYPSAM